MVQGDGAILIENNFKEIASYVALAIEAAAVFVVAFGAIQALSGVVVLILQRAADEMQGREIWLKFATWILLALEFALAADIVRTAVAPTWDDISKLAVIAAIRTMLNYFLAKDIAEFDQARESGGNPPSSLRLRHTKVKPLLIDYRDLECGVEGMRLGNLDYAAFVAEGDPAFPWGMPSDEWNAISLNYTSGTTGNPKGVVYHHRGAALMCYSNAIATGMGQHPVYLWTLPMFHCNGWCFPWSISLLSGTHVCLRAVRAKPMYDAIAEHRVTHLSGAPFVMSALLNAGDDDRRMFPQRVAFSHAAAPPPAAVLAKMDESGFELTHLYGLTETYGPATLNEWHAAWDELPAEDRLGKRIRQGVRYHALEDLTVMDPETMQKTPADGETLGEVMFRGNIVMKGYLHNQKATEDAFAGGWFHSGDLGVMHPDGYIQLKDRSKDIIISGGENISSIEVEDVLYKHPAVAAAAVVAKPDPKWGETPCAFVELRPGATATAEEIIAWCKEKLARYKCPSCVMFVELPKTSTGKIQKFKLRDLAKDV